MTAAVCRLTGLLTMVVALGTPLSAQTDPSPKLADATTTPVANTAPREATSMATANSLGSVSLRCLGSRELSVPFSTELAGAAPIYGYRLWYTTDHGKTWQTIDTLHKGPSPIPFEAPSDGHYGFLVRARDHAGKEQAPPQPGSLPDQEVIVDTTPPVLRVLRPGPKPFIYSGEPLILEFEADDANLEELPVKIEWRRSGDKPWQRMNRGGDHPRADTFRWWSPLVDGTFDVRIIARDRAGNSTIWTTEVPVRVIPFDGFRGARSIAADPYSAFRKFPIFYRVVNFHEVEIGQVELWSRFETGRWQLNVDPNRTSPFVFEAQEDGNYYFYLRVVDMNGNADRPPPGPDTPFDHRVVVDTHPPAGRLLVGSNEKKIAHKGGEPLRIQWLIDEQNLPQDGTELQVSINGGTTWQTLPMTLETRSGRGELQWPPPLGIESQSMRLRLQVRDLADNRTIVMSPTRVQLINPRLDPKRTAEEHYQLGLRTARLTTRGQVGRRPQLLKALEQFDVAILYDPTHPDAWHDRGVIYSMLGEHRIALDNYVKAKHLKPGDIPFTFHLVRAHLRLVDLGMDPDGEHLRAAESVLATVGIEAIYNYPPGQYSDLMSRYQTLKQDLRDRRLAR